MKGYKIFNSDGTCRDFRYVPGVTARMEGPPVMCQKGFHFCARAVDCLSYYHLHPNNRYAEVRAVGTVVTSGDKSVTNALDIVRELSYDEFKSMCSGVVITWDNGVKTSEQEYVNGLLEGVSTDWSHRGKFRRQCTYKNGYHDGTVTYKWFGEGPAPDVW